MTIISGGEAEEVRDAREPRELGPPAPAADTPESSGSHGEEEEVEDEEAADGAEGHDRLRANRKPWPESERISYSGPSVEGVQPEAECPVGRGGPRLASRHEQDDEERAQRLAGQRRREGAVDDAVRGVVGHPQARVLHDLRTAWELEDVGVRAQAERRRVVGVGLEVEHGDCIVEVGGAEEASGGDAADDSDPDCHSQRRHV